MAMSNWRVYYWTRTVANSVSANVRVRVFSFPMIRGVWDGSVGTMTLFIIFTNVHHFGGIAQQQQQKKLCIWLSIRYDASMMGKILHIRCQFFVTLLVSIGRPAWGSMTMH